MQKLIIFFSLYCWVCSATAAPLNKFVPPPEDAPIMRPAPNMQQQAPYIQQRPAPRPDMGKKASPEKRTLKQRWEKLRSEKIEAQTNRLIAKLKGKMQTLSFEDKVQWYDKFKLKYQKSKTQGEKLATSYYKKMLDVSEQLIGKDMLEGMKK